jgi:hypothetical protein
MNEWQGKLKHSEKTCPSAALATTGSSHGLSRSRTRAVAVECHRQTAGATARLGSYVSFRCEIPDYVLFAVLLKLNVALTGL